MKIGIIVFAQNNYLTFFEQYYKSFTKNFLPGISKKFIVLINENDVSDFKNYVSQFTNNDCEFVACDMKDYNTYFINK